MAIQLNIDVAGAQEFKTALKQFDSGMQRKVHERLENWAQEVKASALQQVPVKTGQLRDSIYAKIGCSVPKTSAKPNQKAKTEKTTTSIIRKV